MQPCIHYVTGRYVYNTTQLAQVTVTTLQTIDNRIYNSRLNSPH